jgi:hypothetical protein
VSSLFSAPSLPDEQIFLQRSDLLRVGRYCFVSADDLNFILLLTMFSLFKKRDEKKSDFELEDDEDDEADTGFTKSLQLNLSRLIVYAESADVKLQREVTFSLLEKHTDFRHFLVKYQMTTNAI